MDFIIEDAIAIDVKTTQTIHSKPLKGLRALMEENICRDYYLLSFDNIRRQEAGITILPWQAFLSALWAGEIIS